MVNIPDLSSLTDHAVRLLQALIRTPSVSGDEGSAADILQDCILECGLRSGRVGNNVWCWAEGCGTDCPTLLLNAHIDTVKPVSGWSRDPFQPVFEGNRLYGLGANDDGASVVSLLEAFRFMIGTKQRYNLIFLASAEEEVSGRGGIESALPLLPFVPDVALVGEPTGMQPAVCERGLMVLDVTAEGCSGHAARDEGVNAIYRALDDINWFRSFRFPKQSLLLGHVRMSVTIINAGTQHNVVPDRCTFTVDVRSNECYTNQQIYQCVCEHVASHVHARSFRLSSSSISPEHPLVARAVALGGVPFGSPTLSDRALLSCPALKMGPGDSARSHGADEYVVVDEISHAIETYIGMLDGLRF